MERGKMCRELEQVVSSASASQLSKKKWLNVSRLKKKIERNVLSA